MKDGVVAAAEQAGADVTAGYQGKLDVAGRTPITDAYFKKGLCPVNVHWHLGTEHRSAGQYDESGNGPFDGKDGRKDWKSHDSHVVHGPNDSPNDKGDLAGRRLAGDGALPRQGEMCYHYDTFTDEEKTEYDWKYCKDMHV